MSMSPMKKTKHYLDIIQKELKDRFDFLRLNRAKPKYNPHRYSYSSGYSLGVNSDHIMIFKDKEHHSSFGIVFNYLGLKEQEHTFQFSYKEVDLHCVFDSCERTFDDDEERKKLNKTICYSQKYELSEFKIKLKELINVIENSSDNKEIFNFICKHTEASEERINFEETLVNARVDFDAALKNKKADLDCSKHEYEEAKEIFLASSSMKDNIIKSSDTYKRVQELEKELAEAKRLHEIAESNMDVVKATKERESEVLELRRSFYNKKYQFDNELKEELSKYPIYVREILRRSLDEEF